LSLEAEAEATEKTTRLLFGLTVGLMAPATVIGLRSGEERKS